MKLKASKEEFEKYLKIQQHSDKVNSIKPWFEDAVCKETGLSHEKYQDIIAHYGEYWKQYK